jgi:putative transcriptional regulator
MSKVFDDMMEGAEAALAYAKGEKVDVIVHEVEVPEQIDVAAIRKRLKVSQAKFAKAFGFDIATLRNWEQNRRIPPKHVRAYLKVIDKHPDAVREALAR